jgi:hypothetical protein
MLHLNLSPSPSILKALPNQMLNLGKLFRERNLEVFDQRRSLEEHQHQEPRRSQDDRQLAVTLPQVDRGPMLIDVHHLSADLVMLNARLQPVQLADIHVVCHKF